MACAGNRPDRSRVTRSSADHQVAGAEADPATRAEHHQFQAGADRDSGRFDSARGGAHLGGTAILGETAIGAAGAAASERTLIRRD